ncbi:MAG: flagellar assembly protein FliH [Geopsychrobacter sp.]|nr:flagellar assembly protein FliH [Geopsychrobacter sp.]
MNLSKVYRGQEYVELESFEFRSFAKSQASVNAVAESSSAALSASPHQQSEVNEAFKRGQQEGASVVESKLESTLQALLQALDEVNQLREKVARNSNQDMLRMVMAISEQVILRSLKLEPEIVLSVIENALNSSVQADSYRIRVSALDLDLVNEQKPLFLASISGMKNISIIADATITPGGCRVESDFGDVDATIESQLEKIHQTLAGVVAENG